MSETSLILRSERDITTKVRRSPCKVPAVLVTFQWNLNCPDKLSENPHISNFMKIRPLGAVLFHADGRTDMTKLTAAFHSFANEPKNSPYIPYTCSTWLVFVTETHCETCEVRTQSLGITSIYSSGRHVTSLLRF